MLNDAQTDDDIERVTPDRQAPNVGLTDEVAGRRAAVRVVGVDGGGEVRREDARARVRRSREMVVPVWESSCERRKCVHCQPNAAA